MTLSELLGTLQNTATMIVTVKDADNSDLVKFYANGYEQIVESVLSREVDKLTVANNAITVVLKGGISA